MDYLQIDSKATLNACIAQMVWRCGTYSDCCLSLLCCLLSSHSGSPTTHCPYIFSIQLEWVYDFWTFLQKYGSREVQNKPHLTSPSPFHPPLVAIHLFPEKCCRITGGVAVCWAGNSFPEELGKKDKSQGYLAFSSCALGWGPLRTGRFLLPLWDGVKWGKRAWFEKRQRLYSALSKAVMVLQY